MRACKSCGESKPYEQFKAQGPSKRAASCFGCLHERRTARRDINRDKWNASSRIRRLDIRASGARRADDIYHDSRQSDKRFGRQHSILVTEISTMVTADCSYCGCSASEAKMTIDRVDNAIGHTTENCVPACVRCNLTRGNMPYVAWQYLCSGMRAAREAGAFGDWVGPKAGAKRRSDA